MRQSKRQPPHVTKHISQQALLRRSQGSTSELKRARTEPQRTGWHSRNRLCMHTILLYTTAACNLRQRHVMQAAPVFGDNVAAIRAY